jgi:hypothetical protein
MRLLTSSHDGAVEDDTHEEPGSKFNIPILYEGNHAEWIHPVHHLLLELGLMPPSNPWQAAMAVDHITAHVEPNFISRIPTPSRQNPIELLLALNAFSGRSASWTSLPKSVSGSIAKVFKGNFQDRTVGGGWNLPTTKRWPSILYTTS